MVIHLQLCLTLASPSLVPLPPAVVRVSVNKKNTPPEKNTLAEIILKNTTSGAEEEFLLLCCRAKAHGRLVFLHRHRCHFS